MKYTFMISFLASLFAIGIGARGPTFTRGVRVASSKSQRASNTFTCKTTGLQCADDCSTLATCVGPSKPVRTQTCASINPKKPYCVNDLCTATPDENDANCKSSSTTGFTCTSEGVFPDPTDCTAFHYCSDINADPQKFQCQSNSVYFSKLKLCRRRTQPSFCQRVDCSKPVNGVALFKPDPAYFAVCPSTSGGVIYMLKCLDDKNEIYDPSINDCRYNCKRQGNFPDRTNCNGYITCSRINGKWQPTKNQCPPNYYFSNGSCAKQTSPCVSEIQPTGDDGSNQTSDESAAESNASTGNDTTGTNGTSSDSNNSTAPSENEQPTTNNNSTAGNDTSEANGSESNNSTGSSENETPTTNNNSTAGNDTTGTNGTSSDSSNSTASSDADQTPTTNNNSTAGNNTSETNGTSSQSTESTSNDNTDTGNDSSANNGTNSQPNDSTSDENQTATDSNAASSNNTDATNGTSDQSNNSTPAG